MNKDAFLSVPGHLCEAEGYLLQRLANGKRVFEIGSHHCRSAVAMAATAECIDTIDNYAGDAMIGAPDIRVTASEVQKSGLAHKIKMLEGDFLEYLQTHDMSQYGMIFYDGPHTPPLYEKDFFAWASKTNFRGIIAVHDTFKQEPEMRFVTEAVQEFEKTSNRFLFKPVAGTSISWFDEVGSSR